MSKLIFFLGPAGSGKTTLAKALARKRQSAFFDMDTLSRPASEMIMVISGLDPNDRDSPVYKNNCRDLGYRITMDVVLENLELGTDVSVVGPFSRECENPLWLERELLRIGAPLNDVEVKVIYVFLPGEKFYKQRIIERGSPLDSWKIENWSQFSPSLTRREIKWPLPASSILYFDNSGPLNQEKLITIDRFAYGEDVIY